MVPGDTDCPSQNQARGDVVRFMPAGPKRIEGPEVAGRPHLAGRSGCPSRPPLFSNSAEGALYRPSPGPLFQSIYVRCWPALYLPASSTLSIQEAGPVRPTPAVSRFQACLYRNSRRKFIALLPVSRSLAHPVPGSTWREEQVRCASSNGLMFSSCTAPAGGCGGVARSWCQPRWIFTACRLSWDRCCARHIGISLAPVHRRLTPRRIVGDASVDPAVRVSLDRPQRRGRRVAMCRLGVP